MTVNRLLILGATGDLTERYLLRALAELAQNSLLLDDIEIVGVDQEPWDDTGFQVHATERLQTHASDVLAPARACIVNRLRYVGGNVTNPDIINAATRNASGPIIAYLALPPAVSSSAIAGLADAALPDGSRIIIEKPFGTSLDSACALNSLLARHFPERSIFRMDHFLGKQTVQNILGLRFANRLFEPLWCSQHIQRVDIIWDETVALEGRAGYYDRTGALLDMVQNHLLQLLALVAMERPAGLGEKPLRDAKVDVLRAVGRLSRDEVSRHTIRARYTQNGIGIDRIPDYIAEKGVNSAHNTETFVDVTLFVNNLRWQGVPFRIRTGKALSTDRREICIQLRPTKRLPFGQLHEPIPNVLTLAMDPDRLIADIALNGAGDPFDLEAARWELKLAPQQLSAYARLLMDAFDGDPALSIRGDEAEEAWRIVEPIINAWHDGVSPLLDYPARSTGPSANRL